MANGGVDKVLAGLVAAVNESGVTGPEITVVTPSGPVCGHVMPGGLWVREVRDQVHGDPDGKLRELLKLNVVGGSAYIDGYVHLHEAGFLTESGTVPRKANMRFRLDVISGWMFGKPSARGSAML